MAFSASLLCSALADRLNAVVPDGFSVRAVDGFVRVKSAKYPSLWSATGIQSIIEQPAADITLAAYNALNCVQDFISEETCWPWPPMAGRSRTYMAMPWATIKDGNLVLGYGETDEHPLAIEPIPLHALDDGAASTNN